MPFQSKSQLRTCFSKEAKAKAQGKKTGWNCKKWLKETKDPDCLPSFKGRPRKCVTCRRMRKGEKIVGPVQTGPRGGRYFFVGCTKVYF